MHPTLLSDSFHKNRADLLTYWRLQMAALGREGAAAPVTTQLHRAALGEGAAAPATTQLHRAALGGEGSAAPTATQLHRAAQYLNGRQLTVVTLHVSTCFTKLQKPSVYVKNPLFHFGL